MARAIPDAAVDVAGDDDLRALLRLAARPDGVTQVLELVARRLSGHAALIDPAGVPRHAASARDAAASVDTLRERLSSDIRKVAGGPAGAVAVDQDGFTARIVPVGTAAPHPVLVAWAPRGDVPGDPAGVRRLVTDAADALGLAWQLSESVHRRDRIDRAEAHLREAVLHLVLTGGLTGARRAAAAMLPALADVVRLYIVETAAERTAAAADACTTASGGAAWVVRCPVYSQHVIVIAPAPPHRSRRGPDTGTDRALRALAGDTGYAVGAGRAVPLRELSVSYRQAFHALSVARHRAEGYAEFRAHGELAELLGDAGAAWATATLAPLLAHRRARPQDPDAQDLIVTLASWLDFYSRATGQLKVHRNTLTARLHQIERVLGRDLGDLPTQAELYLALQLFEHPRLATVRAGTLDALLDDPDVHAWAESQVAPLRDADGKLRTTLRTWLTHHAQTRPTAAALGVSAFAIRKRLARVEDILGRSLLLAPSARYELWLALHCLDAADPGTPSWR